MPNENKRKGRLEDKDVILITILLFIVCILAGGLGNFLITHSHELVTHPPRLSLFHQS